MDDDIKISNEQLWSYGLLVESQNRSRYFIGVDMQFMHTYTFVTVDSRTPDLNELLELTNAPQNK